MLMIQWQKKSRKLRQKISKEKQNTNRRKLNGKAGDEK